MSDGINMERIGSDYMGKPCRISEMTVGNTVFTVISVQSESAKETAYEKVRKHILNQVEKSSKEKSGR
jgi:hypothetical protein